MARKRRVERYEHESKRRNNPPVGLATSDDAPARATAYAYDEHFDPSLRWAGKAERESFAVDEVSLHVHEKIDPHVIIDAARSRNGDGGASKPLFETVGENPSLREAVEFYRHEHNWSNRLVAGDSLLVMNSLLQREGMAGAAQCVYMDPPYGIKYGSNFQPFVGRREVKDGADSDLTVEPEMIKAFRDTWELGIHSYLSYLRDRLLLARELLADSGSCFVQISDDNVHLVRCVMDEIFGAENFVVQNRFSHEKPPDESEALGANVRFCGLVREVEAGYEVSPDFFGNRYPRQFALEIHRLPRRRLSQIVGGGNRQSFAFAKRF